MAVCVLRHKRGWAWLPISLYHTASCTPPLGLALQENWDSSVDKLFPL